MRMQHAGMAKIKLEKEGLDEAKGGLLSFTFTIYVTNLDGTHLAAY